MYVSLPFVATTTVESKEYEYMYFILVPSVRLTEVTGIVLVAVST